jgi:hypothetical protein
VQYTDQDGRLYLFALLRYIAGRLLSSDAIDEQEMNQNAKEDDLFAFTIDPDFEIFLRETA